MLTANFLHTPGCIPTEEPMPTPPWKTSCVYARYASAHVKGD